MKRIEDEDSDAEEEDVQGQIRKEIFEGSGDVSRYSSCLGVWLVFMHIGSVFYCFVHFSNRAV